MSTSQLFQPDAAHLQALQDIAVKLYREATQCNIDGMQVMGMTEVFEVKTLQATLDKYAALIAQGYTPSTQVGHVPKLVSLPLFDFFTLHLQKPAAQVEADIAQIKAEVEARYLEQLTQAKLELVEKEVDSLIRGARDKRADAEAKAKAAADIAEYERVKAEVLAALGGK